MTLRPWWGQLSYFNNACYPWSSEEYISTLCINYCLSSLHLTDDQSFIVQMFVHYKNSPHIFFFFAYSVISTVRIIIFWWSLSQQAIFLSETSQACDHTFSSLSTNDNTSPAQSSGAAAWRWASCLCWWLVWPSSSARTWTTRSGQRGGERSWDGSRRTPRKSVRSSQEESK